ncbi:MAG: purine-nucleoside phosphorylase [Planctomycetota bacterium]
MVSRPQAALPPDDGPDRGFAAAVEAAADALRSRLAEPPRAVFLLGTGHEALAAHLADARTLSPTSLPAGVAFAQGAPLHAGRIGTLPVLIGSAVAPYHLGATPREVVLPLRVLRRLGAEVLVLTGGVASLGAEFAAGAIAVVEDHIDLSATHLLRATPPAPDGPRFLDQREPYSERLRRRLHAAAERLESPCREAVLAALPGPVLPTRAECRALRALGAQLVSMSLVPEAIAARHAGFEVLTLAAVVQNLDDAGIATSIPDLLAAVDHIAPRLDHLLLACAHVLASPD